MQNGLRKFSRDGAPATKKEVQQMHVQLCFKAIAIAELTCHERMQAQESLMFLLQKGRKMKREVRLQWQTYPSLD